MNNEVIPNNNEVIPNNNEVTENNNIELDDFDYSPLGTSLLQLEKASSEELGDDFHKIEYFADIDNSATGEKMICFTVEDMPEKYFWASSSLFDILFKNETRALEDPNTRALYFPRHEISVKHAGKVPLKKDPSRTCNTWKIDVKKIK